jgi:NAD(P)-dependent dehydrogenase (short-subunit alcohol dehydrogenase family)
MAGVSAASKAALISLACTAARENVQAGITVNTILPGTMDTPANRAANPSADPSGWVRPQSVADLIVHLLSDAASQISGAVIPVYGMDA